MKIPVVNINENFEFYISEDSLENALKSIAMPDYSISFFGKSLADLTYQDISDYFIDEHGENNNIEFKAFSKVNGRFERDIKGVIRAICGLLNSDGGVVIWGAPMGIEDPITHEKRFVGALSPTPEYKEKDWVINKVSDNITPLPTGIKVVVLQKATSENLYIFEVQPSPYKPHQFENTYLVRLDGQTKPAPHYFIQALFRQITYPNIEGYLKFNKAGIIQNQSIYYVSITIFLFNFSQLQNEENVIYRLMVFPGVIQSQMSVSDPFSYSNSESLLHFGSPMTNNQTILLKPDELSRNNFQVQMVLSVAGKKSPVKVSEYTLNLKNVNLDREDDTSKIIASKVENLLLSEKQEKLGTTREKTIFTAIGRKP